MNFIEAINLLDTRTVKAVRHSKWCKERYVFYDTDYDRLSVTLDKPSCNTKLRYTPPIHDILATDWEVYEEQEELHTFEEAIAALKDGKTIKRENWKAKVIERDFCDDYSVEFTIDDFEANDWIIVGEKI